MSFNENSLSHRTKIIATVGPACMDYQQMKNLIIAGVNVFRLNFSHGDHSQKQQIINTIRKLNDELNVHVAILADLQGPKLRIGEVENNAIDLKKGDTFYFTNEKIIGNKNKIFVSYTNLYKDVKLGEKILLDDGKLEVEVIEIASNHDVKVKVNIGGTLNSKKGVNLPDTSISLPALTDKDLNDLDFIISQQIDWVALSFVRSTNDILDLKERLKNQQTSIKVIAKIEKPEAVKQIRDIINVSDGIMIARGDLGVELPIEEIPLIQKEIIIKCLHRAKPVIVATQMMESMMDRTKPNRSEITDVANAVLEGTDAVMLSGETATGNNPELVVKTMVKIIREVEKKIYDFNRDEILHPQKHSPTFLSDAICYNACKLAEDIHAKAIIGTTQSGYTAFTISSYRPKAPIFIFTKVKTLVNQLSLSWGVRSFFYDEEESLDDIFNDVIEILKQRNLLCKGDVVVNTGSTPLHQHLPTNVVKYTIVE